MIGTTSLLDLDALASRGFSQYLSLKDQNNSQYLSTFESHGETLTLAGRVSFCTMGLTRLSSGCLALTQDSSTTEKVATGNLVSPGEPARQTFLIRGQCKEISGSADAGWGCVPSACLPECERDLFFSKERPRRYSTLPQVSDWSEEWDSSCMLIFLATRVSLSASGRSSTNGCNRPCFIMARTMATNYTVSPWLGELTKWTITLFLVSGKFLWFQLAFCKPIVSPQPRNTHFNWTGFITETTICSNQSTLLLEPDSFLNPPKVGPSARFLCLDLARWTQSMVKTWWVIGNGHTWPYLVSDPSH